MIDYNKIAEKHEISPETVKEVEKGIFAAVRYYIDKYPGIKILLTGLGSFQVRESKIRNMILNDFKKYKDGKLTRDELKKLVTKRLEIKKRALNSRRVANGKRIYKS